MSPVVIVLLVMASIVGWLIWYLFAKIWFHSQLRSHRTQAVKQSRSVVLWQVNEKIAPMLPDFPYEFKDLTFVGKGVDYVVFDWLAQKNLQEIVLLEIKSWQSNLNANERMIKECIMRGDVRYELLRI